MAGDKKNPSVVIIGAGMTGINLVIKLREAGITDITVLEKTHTLGGTWRENTYPGVACDVPAHAYTYSYAPNPDWTGMFAPGDEIQRYFEKVFADYKVGEVTNFNKAVTDATYNNGVWSVKTNKDNTYEADLLFSASGILHKPVTPDFEGLDSYKGHTMHSAGWDHDYDFKGKKIGVIGVGSSAAQLIPELINTPDTDVTVFQRTPQWVIKLENKPYSEKQKQKFRDKPIRMKRLKDIALMIFGKGTTALVSDKWFDRKIMHPLMSWNAKQYLNKEIKDPELREKLTPKYMFGCKRVVMNATFYPAIQKPNAHLEVNGIDKFEENGIRTKDGKFHELDVVVFATGFDPVAYMRPMKLTGKNGLTLDEAWSKKTQAYKSMFVPEFPNFIMLLGPNSPIGNYSVISMSEIQAEYALKLIDQWRDGTIETIEAKPEALEWWRALLKEKMGGTVWASGGCNSWYLDADGDPLTWPDTWGNWLKLMNNPKLEDFHKREVS